ncbi:MAG TPA: phosphodiester glycosidase family protein, partial [Oscillatoriaceae cyanobacterium]
MTKHLLLAALLPFLVAATPAPTPPASSTALPGLMGVRVQADAQTAQLTLQLPAAVPFQARSDDQGWSLTLPGLGAGVGAPPFSDPVLTGFTANADSTGLTLHLNWAYWCPSAVTTSADGLTLTVNFQKVYHDEQDETLAPGVIHAHLREADENGPLNIHVLRVDTHQAGVRLAPVLSGKGFFGREPVEAMLARTHAIAGVNGSYFSLKTGEPAGLLMLDGRVIASPYANRAALAIGQDGQLYIGNTDLASRLVLPGGQSYDFDGVNKPCGLNRMVLYNGAYGDSITAVRGAREFALQSDGTVCAIQDASCAVPVDGYVIAAQGQPAEWLSRYVKLGTRVQVENPLLTYWPNARSALGGGPILVQRGQIQIDA